MLDRIGESGRFVLVYILATTSRMTWADHDTIKRVTTSIGLAWVFVHLHVRRSAVVHGILKRTLTNSSCVLLIVLLAILFLVADLGTSKYEAEYWI